jgi:hypothetical protein
MIPKLLTEAQVDRSLSDFTLYKGLPRDPVTRKVTRLEQVIAVPILMASIFSPFVAISIIGGMSVQRCVTLKNRTKREWLFEFLILISMLTALVLQPLLQALILHQRDQAMDRIRSIIDGRQLDLRLPKAPKDILAHGFEVGISPGTTVIQI